MRRELGIKWPFQGDRRVDMRYVCPKDVKNILMQQARTSCWKRLAAMREHEEL